MFANKILPEKDKKEKNKLVCLETQNMLINHGEKKKMTVENSQQIFSLTPYHLSNYVFYM